MCAARLPYPALHCRAVRVTVLPMSAVHSCHLFLDTKDQRLKFFEVYPAAIARMGVKPAQRRQIVRRQLRTAFEPSPQRLSILRLAQPAAQIIKEELQQTAASLRGLQHAGEKTACSTHQCTLTRR